jgi:acetoacetyl-CoA synthetase
MPWTPSERRIGASTLARYASWLAETRGLTFGSYEEMWRWSVDDLEGFWRTIIELCDIRMGGAGAATVLAEWTMPGTHWFPSATVSYPEHIFRGVDPAAIAIRHTSETRPELGAWTWSELREQTARIADGLQARGVGEGDRVCA